MNGTANRPRAAFAIPTVFQDPPTAFWTHTGRVAAPFTVPLAQPVPSVYGRAGIVKTFNMVAFVAAAATAVTLGAAVAGVVSTPSQI